VFHVSQLKPRLGLETAVEPTLPIMGPGKVIQLVPKKILKKTIAKKRNEPVVQVLVKWVNTAEEDSTWKDYEEIARNYPNFILRDKDAMKRGGMSVEKKLQFVRVFFIVNKIIKYMILVRWL
jgi:Chromo (CHRromatin Organisation MOdifier) domain